MRRRDFLSASTAAFLGSALPSLAQQANRIYKVGMLGAGRVHNFVEGMPALLEELRKAGFDQGRNVRVLERHVMDGATGAPREAAALLKDGADLIIAVGPEFTVSAAIAARPAGPVLMIANHFDAVEKGYAVSLARPDRGLSGVNAHMHPLTTKQLELLAEAFPEQRRVGVVFDAVTADRFAVVQTQANRIGLALVSHGFDKLPYVWEPAFEKLKQGGAESLLVLSSTYFTPHQRTITELALKHRLPSMFVFPLYVDAGGLMSYSYDSVAIYRRIGQMAARVLSGTAVGELPIEQPSRLHLTLNMKTAKALGIDLPTSILLRADKVIE